MKEAAVLWKIAIGCSACFALNICACDQPATAQSINPLAPYKSRLTIQNSGENAALIVHRNSLGKPCLNIEAASRAHVINPNVYDNIVSFQNQCNILIKVRVCYFGTESCVDAEVPAQQRRDTVLGVRPQSQYFRYSYKEKF
jgi:hypothetical protein